MPGGEVGAASLSELVAGVDESAVVSPEPPQPMIAAELHNAVNRTAQWGLKIVWTEVLMSTTP